MFIYTIPRPDAGYQLSQRCAVGRVGQLDVDGKSVRLVLIENDNDARFDKFVAAGDKPRPFWLMADVDGDGQFDPYAEKFDARLPIKLGGTTYELSAPIDGSRLALTPTTKVAQEAGKKAAPRTPAPRQPLLAAGTVAPDFTALTAGNKPVPRTSKTSCGRSRALSFLRVPSVQAISGVVTKNTDSAGSTEEGRNVPTVRARDCFMERAGGRGGRRRERGQPYPKIGFYPVGYRLTRSNKRPHLNHTLDIWLRLRFCPRTSIRSRIFCAITSAICSA